MECSEICECVGDGILKLASGQRVWQYVPDFDWRSVRDHIGPSPLYNHLVPEDVEDNVDSQAGVDPSALLLQTVCRVLDLKEEEVSIDVPLRTYGIDSLSAAALSFALRPLLAVSQVQLLADVTIKYMQSRLEKPEIIS